ncbi:hypothetical protein AK812_SmicGene44011 [Symbiodinium microadriaticum]|uniref:Uncharacterized protein n=1 Tax=Symbiodinium microadriaticum TaxID=2951 RepID=A0A1Q9BZK4_SYMMI|nr:hypothetical protein AK812_SmicGene44011 [Symbiodinium microadriaticum]
MDCLQRCYDTSCDDKGSHGGEAGKGCRKALPLHRSSDPSELRFAAPAKRRVKGTTQQSELSAGMLLEVAGLLLKFKGARRSRLERATMRQSRQSLGDETLKSLRWRLKKRTEAPRVKGTTQQSELSAGMLLEVAGLLLKFKGARRSRLERATMRQSRQSLGDETLKSLRRVAVSYMQILSCALPAMPAARDACQNENIEIGQAKTRGGAKKPEKRCWQEPAAAEGTGTGSRRLEPGLKKRLVPVLCLQPSLVRLVTTKTWQVRPPGQTLAPPYDRSSAQLEHMPGAQPRALLRLSGARQHFTELVSLSCLDPAETSAEEKERGLAVPDTKACFGSGSVNSGVGSDRSEPSPMSESVNLNLSGVPVWPAHSAMSGKATAATVQRLWQWFVVMLSSPRQVWETSEALTVASRDQRWSRRPLDHGTGTVSRSKVNGMAFSANFVCDVCILVHVLEGVRLLGVNSSGQIGGWVG